MFCPTCGSEYVDGITNCSDCGAALVDRLPKLDTHGGSGGDDEPLRMVYIAGPTEAPMIEELLGNNGIQCVVQGEAEASLLPAGGELTEVRIWVRESDRDSAGELIEAFFETGDYAEGEPGDSGTDR